MAFIRSVMPRKHRRVNRPSDYGIRKMSCPRSPEIRLYFAGDNDLRALSARGICIAFVRISVSRVLMCFVEIYPAIPRVTISSMISRCVRPAAVWWRSAYKSVPLRRGKPGPLCGYHFEHASTNAVLSTENNISVRRFNQSRVEIVTSYSADTQTKNSQTSER